LIEIATAVIYKQNNVYIFCIYMCISYKRQQDMFTLFVHEIEKSCNLLSKNTCASYISNRNWQTITTLTSIIHITCSIKFSIWLS